MRITASACAACGPAIAPGHGHTCGWRRSCAPTTPTTRTRWPTRKRRSRARSRVKLSRSAVVCCDLDGVVWRGDTPIVGSADAIAALRDAGLRVVFTTNNSSIPIDGYVERLATFGVPAIPDD